MRLTGPLQLGAASAFQQTFQNWLVGDFTRSNLPSEPPAHSGKKYSVLSLFDDARL